MSGVVAGDVAPLGPNDAGVVLQVRDGGPGLGPDDQAVAFERGARHARYRGIRP